MDLSLKSLNSGSGSTLGDYKFLYGFVSLIRPKRILEIGTHRGASTIAMAMALRDEGLEDSRIISVDIIKSYLEIAAEQIERLGLSKYVELVHGNSSMVRNYPFFDVVFIDGNHSYEGCKRDFENVKDKATYIILHDAVSTEDVAKLVKEISRTMEYELLNIDIGNAGEQWSLNKLVYRSFPGIAVVKVK